MAGEWWRPPQEKPGEDFTSHAARLGGLAARVLGWRPDEFWRATPAELAAILAPSTDLARPADRATLARLMQEHPDG